MGRVKSQISNGVIICILPRLTKFNFPLNSFQSEEIEAAICPKDDRVPCGDMKAIEEHCAAILGEEITKEAQSHETLKGKNAYNGCLTYVSYHVFEFNHIACCESDVCEDWLMDQFDEMFPDEADEEGFVVGDDEIDDDDDDDEYYRDGEEF